MKNENPINYLFPDEKQINNREKLEKYVYHWKWFVLGVIIAFFSAYFYLRYTPNQYLVTTTILIDDSKNGGGLPSELSAFEDLGILTDAKKSIENEIGILKSRSLMESVVKDLGVNISYFTKGRIHEIEVYKNDVPIRINFFSKDSIFYKTDTSFTVKVISPSKFILINGEKESSVEHVFGETIATKFNKIIITPTNLKDLNINKKIKVQISPLKEVAKSLRKSISTELMDKNSSLIVLSLKAPIKLKAKDILNDLVRIYNKNAVDDKSKIGNNTNLFINERLVVIEKDLSNADKDVEIFKTTNKLTDISSEASLVVDTNAKIEMQIYNIKTQLKLADYVSDYLQNNSDHLIPANLGLTDGTVSLNTENYNRLLLERNRILAGSSIKNPVIINLDNQLSQLKASILQGLINLKSSLNISLQDALSQKYRANSKIYDVPKQEKQYRDIERQQKIVETLYLYLLQKREENSISLAVTTPNSKVIDTANGSNIPVYPKRIIVFFIAVMLGLFIPFFLIYIVFLLDNKVHTVKEIEAVIKAPFIGDIPETKIKTKIIDKNNLDSISESFRMLRTNVFFMISNIKGRGKTIFVTSTIGKEGKTFISVNLAVVLALSNKKVLLIGADIRNPKLSDYLNLEIEKGLTHFLMDEELKISDIIYHSNEVNLDIIATVNLAPNPSEILLMNGRFDELIAYGKENYDFVVVDTAPVKLVTDTFLISQYADLFIYVIRANYLDKRLLELPERLYQEKRLPNMAILLNYSDILKGYGYDYGYGYGKDNVKSKGVMVMSWLQKSIRSWNPFKWLSNTIIAVYHKLCKFKK